MVARRIFAALVSIWALGALASTASAQPLSMAFTEARANVGKQLADEALFAAPDTAPFAAQIDPASGAISNGTWGFPTSKRRSKTRSTASGNPTYEGEQCTVLAEPFPITFATAGSSGGTTNPRSGAPFTAGLTGSGAIAGEWQNMSATPVEPGVTNNENFCENVENQIGGPGGIWMEQKDLAAPSAPQLISTDPASPSLSGTPRILGSAEPGSTVRVYAGSGCTGAPVATDSAAKLGSPGIRVEGTATGTATLSATATDAARNTSGCSAPISYTRIHVDPPPPPPAACIVPKLTGKTLGRARAALRAANCGVGKVHRPKHRKGKKLGQLVVKSSTPSAGTNLAAGSAVNLNLGRKPHKARRS